MSYGLASLVNTGLNLCFKFLNLSGQLSDLLSGHRELLLEFFPLVFIPLELALNDLHILAEQLLLRGQRVIHRCQSVKVLLVVVELLLDVPLLRGHLQVQGPAFVLTIFELLGQLLNQAVLDLHIFLDDLLFSIKLVSLHFEVGFQLRVHFDLFLLQAIALLFEFLRLLGCLRRELFELRLQIFNLRCQGLRIFFVSLSLGFSRLKASLKV